tara:strand:+ start:293 stop:676 length:384 start_codon:yes stop_codon:yes gene_type:complete
MKEHEFIEIDFILGLLRPNAKKIFDEIVLAKKNKMWATVIVFSLAILDNIFNDDQYLEFVDGLDISKNKISKDIIWLRKKRNQILHYDTLDKKNSNNILIDHDLKIDSEKAYNILVKSLIRLFPKQI